MQAQRDLAGSLGFLLLALLGVEESLRLPLGTWQSPAPGLFPLLLSLVLAALALTLLVMALRRRGNGPPDRSAARRRRDVWWTFASLVGFYALLEPLGFLLTSVLLLAFLLRAIAQRGWRITLTVGVGASLASYLLFDRLLKLPLPRGVIGF